MRPMELATTARAEIDRVLAEFAKEKRHEGLPDLEIVQQQAAEAIDDLREMVRMVRRSIAREQRDAERDCIRIDRFVEKIALKGGR